MNQHLAFPLTSKHNEDGDRYFTNDTEHGNIYIYIYIYIDKAGLEDLIPFHETDVETSDGYNFNQGRIDNIYNVIKNLYDLTLKLKKYIQKQQK